MVVKNDIFSLFSSAQSLSCVRLFATPRTAAHPVHHQLPEFTQTHVHQISDAIQHRILCHPLLLPPSIFPSIRVFSNESALRMRWPKYWNFSFNINPSNEQTGLLSFRMDWLDQSVSEEKSDKTEQQRRSEGKALRGKKKICHVVASVDHKIEESSEWNVLEAYRFCVIDIMH